MPTLLIRAQIIYSSGHVFFLPEIDEAFGRLISINVSYGCAGNL